MSEDPEVTYPEPAREPEIEEADNSLSMLEKDRIETLSGLPFTALGDPDKPKAKQMAALAFVLMRRKDKDVKFNDAMALTDKQILKIMEESGISIDTPDAIEVDEDPKELD
jgi:hypothetical protein